MPMFPSLYASCEMLVKRHLLFLPIACITRNAVPSLLTFAILRRSARSIPMFRADFLPFGSGTGLVIRSQQHVVRKIFIRSRSASLRERHNSATIESPKLGQFHHSPHKLSNIRVIYQLVHSLIIMEKKVYSE